MYHQLEAMQVKLFNAHHHHKHIHTNAHIKQLRLPSCPNYCTPKKIKYWKSIVSPHMVGFTITGISLCKYSAPLESLLHSAASASCRSLSSVFFVFNLLLGLLNN